MIADDSVVQECVPVCTRVRVQESGGGQGEGGRERELVPAEGQREDIGRDFESWGKWKGGERTSLVTFGAKYLKVLENKGEPILLKAACAKARVPDSHGE